jgi:hypothetical protein
MIWTLQIKLLAGRWANKPWAATIALDASSTLEDLHYIIQQAVDFDNDHLYGFFVARTPRSRDRVRYDCNYENDDEDEGEDKSEGEDESEEYDDNGDDRLYTTTLESLFPLPKDRKLFYQFDYGDDWIFQISRTRNKPFEAEPGIDYPRLIGESGEKPRQYH